MDVGEFIGLDETALPETTNGDPFDVLVSPNNIHGLVNIETDSLTSDDQGVYTCRIPDESNDIPVDVNIGIYLNGFNSEYLLTVPEAIC